MDIELNEDRIRRYVLAELTEEETESLEAEFFQDDDLFDLVRAVEDELIDDYVAGALSADAQRRFTTRFLTSPERHRRVNLAVALQEAVIVAAQPARPARAPALESVWAKVRFTWPTWRLVLVALPAVVVLSGILMLGRARLRPQGSQPQVNVALQDTSGPATITSDRTVLAALGGLPPTLSRSVRELITTGSATLAQPVALALAGLHDDLTRSALRPGQDPGKATPVPLGPMLTAIRSSRPVLRWKAVPGAREYKVLVADQDRNEVWQASAGTQTQVTVPTGVLQGGRVYFWQVEAFVDRESSPGRAVGFWLMDEQTLRGVEAIEQTYQGSALVLATTYVEYGLYEEALTQVERLAQLNPGSTGVQEILNHLRSQLGQQ